MAKWYAISAVLHIFVFCLLTLRLPLKPPPVSGEMVELVDIPVAEYKKPALSSRQPEQVPVGVGKEAVEERQEPVREFVPFYKLDRPPVPVRPIKPPYPEEARRAGIEGEVLVEVWVDEKGAVKRVKILKSAGYGFDEAVVNTIKNTPFQPALVHGRPVAARTYFKVKFVLTD